MTDEQLPDAKAANVLFWADRVGRLDVLELRAFEADLRRGWSADSLGPVLAAIEARRHELAQTRDYPTCAECGQPCAKPFGWFVVERWEAGRVARRGYACCTGCLIAVAHSQKDRGPASVPDPTGQLQPVEQ